MIRWFRSIATTSALDDPAGSGRGFGTERNPEFELAALLFNVIWGYARHGQRLLGTTIDAVGAKAIGPLVAITRRMPLILLDPA